ncbi:hypothetical protein RhiirB3_433118 [Rhizophagus irregularis]|nr:hypothetical protein RhiirB3_433118 [Rhizophagus irregularis]
MDSTDVQDDIIMEVQMLSKSVFVNLNLKTSLSEVRKKLEKISEIKMNDTFSFAMMTVNNSSTGGSLLVDIARKSEEKIILEKIIDKKSKTLYLSEPYWRFFKDKHKLEYGCSVILERAKSRAFTIVDCEMNEIDNEYEESQIQINSDEDRLIKNDRFLIADIDIPNFAKLGVSIRNSNTKNSNVATSLNCNIIEYKKRSLRLKLEPTKEFIEAIKDVIDSKDPRKFKDIINDFGQFIPKEIILGGKACFIANENTEKNSEENSGEYSANIGAQVLNMEFGKKSSRPLNTSNSSKYQSFKLFGGKQFSSSNFDEPVWAESLNDFKCWSCIKFKDPVNVFQILPEDLRKQILLLVEKKILYTNTKYYTLGFGFSIFRYRPRIHHTFELDIPKNILEILQHKDTECSVLAVIDKKEKDCQVICEDPRLKIHCNFENIRKRKLMIEWKIIGYDINFDFIENPKNDFNSNN